MCLEVVILGGSALGSAGQLGGACLVGVHCSEMASAKDQD